MERLRSSASALGPHWKAAKTALNRIPIKNFKNEETFQPLKIHSLSVKKESDEQNQPVSNLSLFSSPKPNDYRLFRAPQAGQQ